MKRTLGDAGKVAIAGRLRAATPVTVPWIAARLGMPEMDWNRGPISSESASSHRQSTPTLIASRPSRFLRHGDNE